MCATQKARAMWEEGDCSGDSSDGMEDMMHARLEVSIYNELMHEVCHGAPGARLSARLRAALERMSPEERSAMVGRTRDGCAPLFQAARRGNVEAVDYLVHVCAADLEQRGVYCAGERRASGAHCVTPLWAAAVAGRLRAVRALVDAGAALDAASDSGSTPVRSACFATHADVVRFLCERGADVHRANHDGGTCLINAVQSARLCRYLVERGAAPDARDARHATALLHAAREHRADSARVLLAAGASPHAVALDGDDALRAAAACGADRVVALLCERVPYPPARVADALELLGATRLDEGEDEAGALAAWRRACDARAAGDAPKETRACAELGGAREWRTREELEAAARDADEMRAQALLVPLRVLGERHEVTLRRLVFRGAAYADAGRPDRCLRLWRWALRIRIEKDTLLCDETCRTLCALTRLASRCAGAEPELARDAALRLLCELAAPGGLARAQRLLSVRPESRAQREAWERTLRCAVHLAHLAPDAAETAAALRALVALRAVTAAGESLLHLACSRLTVVRSAYVPEAGAEPQSPCPSAAAVRRLLAAGADADATDAAGSTPLHVAAVPYNFSTELVERLAAGGAHLDRANAVGDSAAELVLLCRGSRVRVLRHVTLACLAARALRLARLDPGPALPPSLRAFLDMH